MKRIHVVTSCTSRKRIPVRRDRRISQLTESDLSSRLRAWTGRLERKDSKITTSAIGLYGGEHWVEFTKTLQPHFRSGVKVHGWVISAGYGLIRAETPVHPYSASFGKMARDRVRPTAVAWTDSDWWKGLSEWEGPVRGEPRTLTSLGAMAQRDLILIAASPKYLRAVEPDLVQLIDTRSSDQLVVFSTMSSLPTALAGSIDYFARYDSRLRRPLGGSQVGLNIRTLAYAVRETPDIHADTMRNHIHALMDTIPKYRLPNRSFASDDEIRIFIQTELRDDSRARPSSLLRRWRSMGRACEQGRFKDLFFDVHPGTAWKTWQG